MAKDENLHGLLTYLSITADIYLPVEEGVTYDWLQIARCLGRGGAAISLVKVFVYDNPATGRRVQDNGSALLENCGKEPQIHKSKFSSPPTLDERWHCQTPDQTLSVNPWYPENK
jgi:hypothetical protein